MPLFAAAVRADHRGTIGDKNTVASWLTIVRIAPAIVAAFVDPDRLFATQRVDGRVGRLELETMSANSESRAMSRRS